MNVVSNARERAVETSFGKINFVRSYGSCPTCQDHISSLEQIHNNKKGFTKRDREAIARELQYFTGHKDRMDYETAKAAGQPVGSGPIESPCSQYQRRFKLTGQFWTLEGDELSLRSQHCIGMDSSIVISNSCRLGENGSIAWQYNSAGSLITVANGSLYLPTNLYFNATNALAPGALRTTIFTAGEYGIVGSSAQWTVFPVPYKVIRKGNSLVLSRVEEGTIMIIR